jgi:hypothetical protein
VTGAVIGERLGERLGIGTRPARVVCVRPAIRPQSLGIA